MKVRPGGNPSSLSPCGRGCPSHKRVYARLRRAMARAGEGSVPQLKLRPLTRLAFAIARLATLSHKGRGKVRMWRGHAIHDGPGNRTGRRAHERYPRQAGKAARRG